MEIGIYLRERARKAEQADHHVENRLPEPTTHWQDWGNAIPMQTQNVSKQSKEQYIEKGLLLFECRPRMPHQIQQWYRYNKKYYHHQCPYYSRANINQC